MTRIYHRTIFLLLLGALLLAAGCSQASSNEVATPTAIPTPVIPTKPTYEVQRGEVVKEFQFTARVSPALQADVFFRTSGRVRNVYVAKDDKVTEGQVLADLDISVEEGVVIHMEAWQQSMRRLGKGTGGFLS